MNLTSRVVCFAVIALAPSCKRHEESNAVPSAAPVASASAAPSAAPPAAPKPAPAEGLDFVRVNGGSFVPGCVEGNCPGAAVNVAAFEMSATEVPQSVFRRFVDEAGAPKGSCWARDRADSAKVPTANWTFPNEGDDHPVVCVSRPDAERFAAWISKRASAKFRLPTSNEWEFAARAGGQARAYAWGNAWPPPAGAANIADHSVVKALRYEPNESAPVQAFDDGWVYSAPVGKTTPNPLGLYDMTGNVYEWVSDECKVRGGSWDNGMRASDKTAAAPLKTTGQLGVGCDGRFTAAGFRLVREVAP